MTKKIAKQFYLTQETIELIHRHAPDKKSLSQFITDLVTEYDRHRTSQADAPIAELDDYAIKAIMEQHQLDLQKSIYDLSVEAIKIGFYYGQNPALLLYRNTP